MFNKHLFRVILGFCGMIMLGLISMVLIDSLDKEPAVSSSNGPSAQVPAR